MKSFAFLLLLSSCSFMIGGKDAPKTAKGSFYSVPFSLPGWVYKQDKRSDFVFENSKDGRILLSNSFCEEFQEDSLEHLAKKTFNTVSAFRSTKSGYTTFQNREAYKIEGTGQVDGVTVNLRLLNTRRNNCYFDFLSIIPEKSHESDDAFSAFLGSVTFR